MTAIVRAAGPGTYWGANVVAGTGEDRYAGWSLVVVYRAPGLPLRNLTVFDGFADVGRDEPQTISLSGFRTPSPVPSRPARAWSPTRATSRHPETVRG